MKKLLSVLLAALMIATMGCVIAFGASGSLSVSSVSGKPGDTVDVTVNIGSNPGVTILMFNVSYDPALTLTKVTNGSIFPASDMTAGGDLSANPYNLSWGSYTASVNNTGTGKLVTLTFKIAANASAGQKKITITPDADNTVNKDFTPISFNTASGNVTVSVPAVKTLSSIAVTTKPSKTTYNRGEPLNTAGMVVQATYSDGSKSNVTGYTCSPTTLNTAGTKTVTVSYTEGGVTKTTTFTVSVVDPVQPSVTANPSTVNIRVGQSATINYTTVPAGQSVGVSIVSLTHSTYSQSGGKITVTGTSAGTDTLDLVMNYGGQQYKARVTVIVAPVSTKTLSSISIQTKPTKTSYYKGETLNTAGMVVRALYTDGTSASVSSYTCSPTTLNTTGTQTVTVSYTEGGVTKTAAFTVTVSDPPVNPLRVTLTLDRTKIDVKKGESETVTCSYTLSGDTSSLKHVKLRTKNNAGEQMDVKLGDWDGDTITIKISGKKVGSGTVEISLLNADTDEVLDTQVLEVNVLRKTLWDIILDILFWIAYPFIILYLMIFG